MSYAIAWAVPGSGDTNGGRHPLEDDVDATGLGVGVGFGLTYTE